MVALRVVVAPVETVVVVAVVAGPVLIPMEPAQRSQLSPLLLRRPHLQLWLPPSLPR